MKITLTIEESQKLIELGVDAKLASEIEYRPRKCGYGRLKYRVYSLSDILSILPKEIDGYELNISTTKQLYFVSYILWDHAEDYGSYVRDTRPDTQLYAPELIDALNQLAIWAIEHQHLKTEKK